MRIRPDFGDSPPQERDKSSRRGELWWRSVRYGCAVFAGYAFGLAAGSALKDHPAIIPLIFVGAVALLLVFRQGRNSVSHAAADAVAAAIVDAHAEAKAAAVAQQHVTVAQGHIVQGHDVPALPSPATVPSYVGVDAITGHELYQVNGTLYRYDELPFDAIEAHHAG